MFDDEVSHPDKIIVRHALKDAAGNLVEGKPAHIELERFGEVLDRSCKRFGDPSKSIGGPTIPKEKEK